MPMSMSYNESITGSWVIGGVNNGCCSIKGQFFMRFFFRLGTDGWYCVTKGKIRRFVFGFR